MMTPDCTVAPTGSDRVLGFRRPPPLDRLGSLVAEVHQGTLPAPLIAYDTEGIDGEVAALQSDLDGLGQRSARLLFSVKANRFPGVLRHLATRGIGAAVSSTAECRAATGSDMAVACATGPGFTRAELVDLLNRGVQLDVDSPRQLADLPGGAQTGLRLAVPITASSTPRQLPWSRFGLRWPDAEAVAVIAARELTVTRLHCHVRDIGTADDMALLGQVLVDAATVLPSVVELNIGGGMTRLYHANADALGEAYGALSAAFAGAGRRFTVLAEPGAQLVTAHGYLLSRVLTVDRAGGRQLVVLDSSAWNLAGWSRFELVATEARPGPSLLTDLAGPTCYEKDLWLAGVPWDPVRPGDVLVLRGAGAYVTSMARCLHGRSEPVEIMLPPGPATGASR